MTHSANAAHPTTYQLSNASTATQYFTKDGWSAPTASSPLPELHHPRHYPQTPNWNNSPSYTQHKQSPTPSHFYNKERTAHFPITRESTLYNDDKPSAGSNTPAPGIPTQPHEQSQLSVERYANVRDQTYVPHGHQTPLLTSHMTNTITYYP